MNLFRRQYDIDFPPNARVNIEGEETALMGAPLRVRSAMYLDSVGTWGYTVNPQSYFKTGELPVSVQPVRGISFWHYVGNIIGRHI